MTTPTTMKAIRIHEYGNTHTLKYEDAPVPVIADNEVLVKAYAAAINPVDCKMRNGDLQQNLPQTLPLILGWDVAGTIASVGKNVSHWQVGDAIYSRPNIHRDGAYAEYVAVEASEIAPKPRNLSWQQAAAVPLCALTAWQALYTIGNLQAGQKVLITRGSGGFGVFAIQLAKLRGAEVYTTTTHTDLATRLGADYAIDYTQQDFTLLQGMDMVIDAVGGETLKQSYLTLKKGGQMISIISTPEQSDLDQYGVTGAFCFVEPSAEQLTHLAELIEADKLEIIIDSVHPLTATALAHERSQTDRAVGKIILAIHADTQDKAYG